jgi:peptidoglycan/xylan/chitin deacetylase (PgdA/CDA1 family)
MRALILTYHSIDDSGSVISTSPEHFRRQMRQLREASCRVISLEGLAAAVRERRDLPANTVAITFDDGYESVHSEAFPILGEYGFPATVFLVTGRCGRPSPWNANTRKIGPALLVSWESVEEMARGGIDFGSHTVTHPDLTRLRADAVQKEIRDSKRTIEDRLGQAVTAFAYPFGRSTAAVRVGVELEYKCACSARLGAVSRDAALFRLRRIDMHYFSSEARFASLIRGGGEAYLAARSTLRLVRGLL